MRRSSFPGMVFPEAWARLVTTHGEAVAERKLGRPMLPPKVVVLGPRVFVFESSSAKNPQIHTYVETTAQFLREAVGP